MHVDKDRFQALVEASLTGPAGPASPAPADEAGRAAALLGDLVRRGGLMIEVLPDDVRDWLADRRGPALDVRTYELRAPRAVGVGHALEPWLGGVEAVVLEVAGGPDLTLHEVSETAERIYAGLPADVDVVFGASVDEGLRGEVVARIVAIAPA